MEKIAYYILTAVAAVYVLAMLIGFIAAFPFGLIGLFIFSGFGLLFIKALSDRLGNEEDDHYSDNVHE